MATLYHNVRAVLRGEAADHFSLGHYLRCLLYTSDAADERSSVDLGGRRIIKKKNTAAKIEEPTLKQKIIITTDRHEQSPK